MVFNPNEKQRSLDVMKNVGKNVKNNYSYYQRVNYPISIEYAGKTCNETYTGEVAYAKFLSSSFIFNNLNEYSCMIKEMGSSAAFGLFN